MQLSLNLTTPQVISFNGGCCPLFFPWPCQLFENSTCSQLLLMHRKNHWLLLFKIFLNTPSKMNFIHSELHCWHQVWHQNTVFCKVASSCWKIPFDFHLKRLVSSSSHTLSVFSLFEAPGKELIQNILSEEAGMKSSLKCWGGLMFAKGSEAKTS